MSIEKGRINGAQLLFLVAGFVQGSLLLISYAVNISQHQTWMIILAGFIGALPFIFSYTALGKLFPGMNLIQINKLVYGGFLGNIISLYYIFFLFVTLSLNIRDVGNFYTTFFMPDTPLILLLTVFTAVIAYAVAKGIETIAKIAPLIVIIASFITVLTFIMLIPVMDFSNFLPLFSIPPIKFVQGIHVMMSIPFGEMIVFLVIMACLNNTGHVAKNTIAGVIIATITFLAIAVRNTAVLGKSATILSFTSFQSARLIDIGNVLTRMDLLIGVGHTLLIFLKSALFLYAVVVAISQLLRLKSYLPLILPVAGIEVILAATIFQTPVEHAAISVNTGIIYDIPIMFIFPPLSLLVAKIRGLSGNEGRKD